MAIFDVDPAPDEEEPRKQKNDPENLEKVINDLRDVLDGLGSPAKSAKPEENPIFAPLTDPAQSMNPTELNDQLGENSSPPTEGLLREPPPNTPTDAEFWNGNVLGWTSKDGVPPGQEEVQKPNGEPSPADWLQFQSEEAAKKVSELRPELANPAQPTDETPPEPPAETPPEASFDTPTDHSSPSQKLTPTNTAENSPPKTDEFTSPFISGFNQFDENAVPPVPQSPINAVNDSTIQESGEGGPLSREAKKNPPVPEFPESPIPIPGTIDQIPKPTQKETVDFDQPSEAPPGLIQMACFYPEGQEKQSQQFVIKLKSLGLKSSQTLTIEPVYVQAWKESQVDANTWCRAAHLAGATVIFVLAAKKDKVLFMNLLRTAEQHQIKARLVFVEQLGVRTVFADLLDQLKRIAYGKD